MMLEAFRRLQDHRDIVGLGPTTLRALSRALPKIGAAFRRSTREPAPLHGNHAQRPPHVDAAPHEPLRRARPLSAGLRPHRGPDAARPLPRLHRGRAHPHGDPEPAALPHPALRPRVPVPVAAHAGVRPARGALHSPRSSTTSPRGAAATTRTWACGDAVRFCRAHGMATRRCGAGGVAGREPPRDVGHGAEAGPDRSRSDLGLRDPGAQRARAHRALHPHRGRHPRHEPQGVERVEGQAARGPLPPHAPGIARRDRLRRLVDRGQEGRGAAHLPPVRARGRTPRGALGATSTTITSSASRRTRSAGTRARSGTAPRPTSPSCARASHPWAKACRCWCTRPTSRASSRASPASSSACSSTWPPPRSTPRSTASRSTPSRCCRARVPASTTAS